MGKNGWGLIGTGRIADERILPGINAHPGNDLIAVVSRDRTRAIDHTPPVPSRDRNCACDMSRATRPFPSRNG